MSKRILPVEEILERLRLVMECDNDSQLARKLNIPQTTVSTWKKRNIVPYEACAKVASEKELSLDIFIFGEPIPIGNGLAPIHKQLYDACWRIAAVVSKSKSREIKDIAVEYYNQRVNSMQKLRGSMSIEDLVYNWQVTDDLTIKNILAEEVGQNDR